MKGMKKNKLMTAYKAGKIEGMKAPKIEKKPMKGSGKCPKMGDRLSMYR